MLQEIESNQEEGGWTDFVFMLGWKAALEVGDPHNGRARSELKNIA